MNMLKSRFGQRYEASAAGMSGQDDLYDAEVIDGMNVLM